MEAIADDNFSVVQMVQFLFGKVGNIVGKKRKWRLLTFSPFPTMFLKDLVKSRDCMLHSLERLLISDVD